MLAVIGEIEETAFYKEVQAIGLEKGLQQGITKGVAKGRREGKILGSLKTLQRLHAEGVLSTPKYQELSAPLEADLAKIQKGRKPKRGKH